MNLLDENILASQRELLRSWKISARQIGFDFQPKGLHDDQIISLLHQHRRTTLFTRDLGALTMHSQSNWRAPIRNENPGKSRQRVRAAPCGPLIRDRTKQGGNRNAN